MSIILRVMREGRLRLRSVSSNFVEVKLRKLDKDRVIEQIRKGVRSLKGVLCAILFGSLVENRYTGSSDADLLIIIENGLPQNERYRRYNRILADVEVQPLILTLDEPALRIKNGDTFYNKYSSYRHRSRWRGVI